MEFSIHLVSALPTFYWNHPSLFFRHLALYLPHFGFSHSFSFQQSNQFTFSMCFFTMSSLVDIMQEHHGTFFGTYKLIHVTTKDILTKPWHHRTFLGSTYDSYRLKWRKNWSWSLGHHRTFLGGMYNSYKPLTSSN